MLKESPEIGEFFKKLEGVINKWIKDEATDKDIEKSVRDFELEAGWNKARMVVRRLKRSEKVKYEKAKEGEQKDYYKKLLEGLEIAVEFVGRKSRDNRKKSELVDRIIRIASKIVSSG